MLHSIRKNKKGVLIFFITAIVALVMLSFGVNISAPGRKQGVAITIDDEEISYAQYEQRYKDITNRYQQQFGGKFEQFRSMINIRQQSIDSLITERLLERLSSELQLTASVPQIEEIVRSSPFFEGGFDQQKFETYLRALGLSQAALEAETRKIIVNQQLNQLMSDLSVISEKELKALFEREKTKAEFRYISLRSADFESKVNTKKKKKLGNYFKENSENYRKPKSVRYDYVMFDPKNFQSTVELTEEDIKDAYRLRRDVFSEPKKTHLRKILFRTTEETEEKNPLEELLLPKNKPVNKTKEQLQSEIPIREKKKEAAQEALERLEGGEDFAKLASELSDDSSTAKKGGDLGWVTYHDLTTELRQEVGDLEIGTFSKAIETPKGFVLLFVEDIQEPKPKPLEEVREQVEAELRSLDAPEYARVEGEDFFDAWQQSGVKLKEFAKTKERKLYATEGLLSKGNDPSDAPAGLTEKVLSFSGAGYGIADLNDITIIAEVTEVKESHIPKLKEVIEAVRKDFVQSEAKALAKKKAEKLLAQALNKAKGQIAPEGVLSKIAETHKLELKTTASATQNTAFGEPFTSPDIRQAAFTLSEQNPVASRVFENNGAFSIIELAKMTPPEEADFSKEKDKLRRTEWQRSGNRLLAALIETLKAKAEIWVEPSLLKKEG